MSLTWLASLLCMLAAAETGPTQQGVVPEKIERFLELSESSRRGAILRLEHALRGLRNQGPATRSVSRRIADIEEQLRVLRSRKQPVVPQLAFPPKVGAIGRLPRLSCHVDQVVSDDELLVRCSFSVVVTTVRHFQARRETAVQEVQFLIRGPSTADIHEGSDLEMLQVFDIIGKETYKTPGGGSTDVLVLAEFDMQVVEPYFRNMAEQSR